MNFPSGLIICRISGGGLAWHRQPSDSASDRRPGSFSHSAQLQATACREEALKVHGASALSYNSVRLGSGDSGLCHIVGFVGSIVRTCRLPRTLPAEDPSHIATRYARDGHAHLVRVRMMSIFEATRCAAGVCRWLRSARSPGLPHSSLSP